MESNLENKVDEKKTDETNISEETLELKDSIESLEKSIRTTNSNKKVILRGILTGVSGAIGATIVFGLLITLFSDILYKTNISPRLNEFLNEVTNRK